MGFRNDCYAKVWEVKQRAEKYTDAKISVSKKNKQTEQYETEFSGVVRFIGDAHKKAFDLIENSKIKVLNCDTTNKYSKEKGTTYWRCIVYDFDFTEDSPKAVKSSQCCNDDFMNVPDSIDEELPFN